MSVVIEFQLPEDTNCELTIKSPIAEDWQYLVTNPLRSDGKVTFVLNIKTKSKYDLTFSLLRFVCVIPD